MFIEEQEFAAELGEGATYSKRNLDSGIEREIEDIVLSRYACYLVVQNANPSKEVVVLGQTYFAVQTRKQEFQDELDSLSENKNA